MKNNKLIQALFLLGLGSVAIAEIPSQPDVKLYTPHNGRSGYQEIPLNGNSWYVFFEGTRDDKIEKVEAGWATRAAELCKNSGKKYFVEQRYVSEKILKDEPLNISRNDLASGLHTVAGMIFVPIYTPSSPRAINPILTPSKMAAIQCLDKQDQLIDTSRAISVDTTLDKAITLGIINKPISK
jgi:hypothetical protein